MKSMLIWFVPPLIGAIIGYVTNALAIKMLFRPLNEVRVRGVRLPFTPGILPRRRHELAESIGSMVERELLTADIIRERLARDDVRESTRRSIAAYTDKLLNTPIENFVGAANAADATFKNLFSELFRDFGNTPICAALFDSLLTFIVEHFGKADGLLSRSPRDLLGSEETEKLRVSLGQQLETRLATAAPALIEQLSPSIEKVYPAITALFIRFLEKPEVRAQLEAQGRVFLSNAIDRLNPVQRFFLSAGQYNQTLSTKMPEIIDDLIDQLQKLLAADDVRARLLAFFTASALQFAADEESRVRLTGFALDFIFSHADTPLKTLIESVSKRDSHELSRRLFDFIKKRFSTGDPSFIPRFFKFFLTAHPALTLAAAIQLDAAKKALLDDLLRDKLLAIADEEVGAALASINVRALVSDRIDSLDMLQVEHIVLDVMANQLKWINLFGAILGALIGVFQSWFSWLTRGL
jgi:uncharacterized membrane-anchored protein YjiN (DUF445 family)